MSSANIPAPTRIGPECNGMHMLPDEYDDVQDWHESYRYELVNGVLIVTPPAGAGERSPNDDLGHFIRTYQETDPNGHMVDDTLPEQEIKTGDNRRRADRGIWIGLGRQPDPINDVPTIAIEFVSQSSRDRHRDYVEKRREYGEAGVKEYWVIDRFRREMTVFRGTNEELVVPQDETYTTDLLPGFELPLARLLQAADRYRDAEN